MVAWRLPALITLATVSLGCASVGKESHPVYRTGEPVSIGTVECVVDTAWCDRSFTNWVGQVTTASDNFVIAQIAVTNRGREPLAFQFQPVFELLSDSGSRLRMSDQYTIAINLNSSGGNFLDAINPGVTLRKKIVFEAPKQGYRLRVIAPRAATMGFLGSGEMNVAGPYALISLPLSP